MTDDQREAVRVALEVLQSAGLASQGVEAGDEILVIRDAMSRLMADCPRCGGAGTTDTVWPRRGCVACGGRGKVPTRGPELPPAW